MVHEPLAIPVERPLLLMVATAEFSEIQVAVLVTFSELPSL